MAYGCKATGAVVPGFLWGCMLTACGAPEVVAEPKVAVAKPKAEAAAPDAFADHRGERFEAGQKFRLGVKPAAVAGPDVVVTLVKTDWSTMTGPSGKEVREATASLRVQKGEEERAITISQGEDRVAFGARLFVLGAGEAYDPQRLVYQAWVDLRVEKAQ